MAAAQAFFRSAKATAGFAPDRVTTDGHGSYPRAIRSTLGKKVWCADITYVPMRRGFLYLVVIMDWATRRAELPPVEHDDVDFCIAALEEALARFGRPEIFDTDQGSQFTLRRFTEVLTNAGVQR